MVTRIPQPQFVGSAPADVVNQAASTGARYAEIAAQGVTEGLRAYQAEKQIQAQKEIATQRETSAFDQLKLQLQGKDIMDAFTAAGPGNEAKVFVEQADKIKDYYGKLYGPAGDHIFDATSKHVLAAIKGGTALQAGLLGLGAQPQAASGGASATPAPGESATQPQAPTANPSLQAFFPGPGGAQLGPVTSPMGGQAASPASRDAIAAPPIPASAIQATKASTAPAPLQLPTKPNEFTPDIVKSISSDQSYMSDILKTLGAQDKSIQSDADKVKAGTMAPDAFLSKYKTRVLKANEGMGQAATPAAAVDANGVVKVPTSGSDQANTYASITTKGIPEGAKKESLIGGLQKIVDLSMGQAVENITPKEKAAIDSANNVAVRVMRDSQAYKDFIKQGGSDATLEQAAASLKASFDADPTMADYYKLKSVLGEKDFADYETNFKNNAAADAAVARNDLAREKLSNAEAQTAAHASQIALTAQLMSQRIAVQAKNGSLRAEELPAITAYNQAAAIYRNFDTDYRARNPKASDDQVHKAWLAKATDPTTVEYQSQYAAAKLFSPFLKLNPDDPTTVVSMAETYWVPLPFGTGLGEKTPAREAGLPNVVPQGGGAKPPAAGPAAPAKPAGAGSSYASGLGF
jgi:hypothetical protein